MSEYNPAGEPINNIVNDRTQKNRGAVYSSKKIAVPVLIIVAVCAVLCAFVAVSGGNSNKNKVSAADIRNTVAQLQMLLTYSYNYTGEKVIDDLSAEFGSRWSNKAQSLTIGYKGTIKSGYDASDIAVSVVNGNTLCFVLPQKAKIYENYIPVESVSCSQNLDFFTDVTAQRAAMYFEVIKKDELDKALAQGLNSLTESYVCGILKQVFFEYTVVFAKT